MSATPITPGMICDVVQDITCQILSEEALTAPAIDGMSMHRGTLHIYSGDLVVVKRVVGSLALARLSGSLVGIHIKRLSPSEVRHT